MNQYMQPAIQHLFQVSSIDEVSREQLEGMIEEYPCFGYGHYLLSRKLRHADGTDYLSATQRTSLYFSNPFWLQWMLESGSGPDAARTTSPARLESLPPSPAEPVASFETTSPAEPVASFEATTPAEATSPAEPTTPAELFGQANLAEPAEIAEQVEPVGAWPVMTSPEPPADTSTLQTDPQSPVAEDGQTAAEILLDSIEKAKELRESLLKINEDFVARTGHPIPTREPEHHFETGTEHHREPAAESHSEHAAESSPEPAAEFHSGPAAHPDPAQQEHPIQDEEAPFVLDEPEQAPKATPSPDASFTEPTESPAPSMQAESAQSPEQSDPVQSPEQSEPVQSPEQAGHTSSTGSTPLFEPLHTIDYFASQGIRLTLDDNPTDQLGRQLKSFTEWLRMMRRLPQRDREIIPDRVAEEAVQTFAAHSIEGKEPVTETMAEVLIKQGMPARARIVYEKLSLLNPDKSAYFAAKIEQLNSP